MQIRKLGPDDAQDYRALRIRAHKATVIGGQFGFRSFGIEPRAIKVDGHFFAKIHMYMELTPS